MTEALKPCPFCGHEANVWQSRRVICWHCEADGPDTGEDMALADNIAAWNTRAPDPAVQELIEAARVALAAVTHETIGTYEMDSCEFYEALDAAKDALRTAINKLEKTDDA